MNNIDILKEIVKLFQTATEGATTIGIWWLVKSFIVSLVGYGVGFACIIAIYRVLKLTILATSLSHRIHTIINSYTGKDFDIGIFEGRKREKFLSYIRDVFKKIKK